MTNKEIDNLFRKYKSILTVPAGFGKLPLAEKVKIFNKLARSTQAGMAGFVKDYNEFKKGSVKPKKAEKKAIVKKVSKVYAPVQSEPDDIDDFNFGPPLTSGIIDIIKDREWIDPAIVLRQNKVKEAEILRNEAKIAASNILNITLDNVISQAVMPISKQSIKKKRKEKKDEPFTWDDDLDLREEEALIEHYRQMDIRQPPNHPRQGLVMDKIPGRGFTWKNLRPAGMWNGGKSTEGMDIEYIHKGKIMTGFVGQLEDDMETLEERNWVPIIRYDGSIRKVLIRKLHKAKYDFRGDQIQNQKQKQQEKQREKRNEEAKEKKRIQKSRDALFLAMDEQKPYESEIRKLKDRKEKLEEQLQEFPLRMSKYDEQFIISDMKQYKGNPKYKKGDKPFLGVSMTHFGRIEPYSEAEIKAKGKEIRIMGNKKRAELREQIAQTAAELNSQERKLEDIRDANQGKEKAVREKDKRKAKKRKNKIKITNI